jgi:hypothetical protein
MGDLYLRFDGYDDLKAILSESDENVLRRLGRPALICIPGSDRVPRARVVSCLLHGNEDSGYRAVLEMLRAGARFPFDLWVFIGNVRAASHEGWFAHRFLDDQEDFNRVWGLAAPTTRMRRCADAVLDELRGTDLEAAVDLHNNTGQNPFYTVVPRPGYETLTLAATCADTALLWGLRAHTLMEELSPRCPAVAIECSLPARRTSTLFAASALERFLAARTFDDERRPRHLFEMRFRVTVRPEVPFAFGGTLTDDLDLILTPGLDGYNFGMLLAGTELGRIHPGAAVPLEVTGMAGEDATDRFLTARADGRVVVTEDVTPAMMVTTVVQTRRDCLFYIVRRRS